MLQYYACLLPLVDISHTHAAVLLFYNITLFQTVSQWRVFLTKPRPLHPQPGAARRPALPGADRKCFVTKLNPIVNYLSPFPPFPLPVAPLLSPYNASFLSLTSLKSLRLRDLLIWLPLVTFDYLSWPHWAFLGLILGLTGPY